MFIGSSRSGAVVNEIEFHVVDRVNSLLAADVRQSLNEIALRGGCVRFSGRCGGDGGRPTFAKRFKSVQVER